MIFNFDFAEISSLSGMSFSKRTVNNMDELYNNLEDLRKMGELRTTDHAVLLTCCILSKQGTVKKRETYEMAYMDGGWILHIKKSLPSLKRTLVR